MNKIRDEKAHSRLLSPSFYPMVQWSILNIFIKKDHISDDDFHCSRILVNSGRRSLSLGKCLLKKLISREWFKYVGDSFSKGGELLQRRLYYRVTIMTFPWCWDPKLSLPIHLMDIFCITLVSSGWWKHQTVYAWFVIWSNVTQLPIFHDENWGHKSVIMILESKIQHEQWTENKESLGNGLLSCEF